MDLFTPADAPEPKTARVYLDTLRLGTCREDTCAQTVWFATYVKSGKVGIFNGRPTFLAKEKHGTREVGVVDLALTHFATCTRPDRFRR